MHALIEPLLSLFIDHPRLGGLFGLVVAILFGYLGVSSWQAVQTMPQEPEQLALAEAVAAVQSGRENLWVSISDARWDCGNVVREGDRTTVMFTDETQSVLGLAVFSGSQDMTCDDLSNAAATGVLRILGDREVERLDDRGFDLAGYEGASARVGLCTFCARGNSLGLVIVSAVMVVLGLAMYPMFLHLHRQRVAETQPDWLHAAGRRGQDDETLFCRRPGPRTVLLRRGTPTATPLRRYLPLIMRR